MPSEAFLSSRLEVTQAMGLAADCPETEIRKKLECAYQYYRFLGVQEAKTMLCWLEFLFPDEWPSHPQAGAEKDEPEVREEPKPVRRRPKWRYAMKWDLRVREKHVSLE